MPLLSCTGISVLGWMKPSTSVLHELKKRNLTTRHQIPVPLVDEGLTFDVAFKMDWRSLLGVRSLMPRPRLCVRF
jgi:hypothetical protein